jgi:amino acid transporter
MSTDDRNTVADDIRTLHRLDYAQELARRMSGFSNFAISLSIICILAGGITSFHLGFCSVGGAAIGIGWPLVCLFSLVVALTMGQVASAFPTAGGIYHWASILGGRGWGWAAAWFNLAGLITVLAAINVGTFEFVGRALCGMKEKDDLVVQVLVVVLITGSQALFNHLGIRVTTLLTDFSGYLILVVAAALTVVLLACAPALDPARLITFHNYSGLPGSDPVWPKTDSLVWLFALGFLLPAYTITGFDASAHTSEETVGAAQNVPRSMVRSVFVSGIAGWLMLTAIVLAVPDMSHTADQGERAFYTIVDGVVPRALAVTLYVGIGIAQYLCGLATVTSASRMAYAFARDGGLPFSAALRHVSPRFRTPALAIWVVSAATVLFTVYTPVYSTITAVCAILLYISYVLPTALGFVAYGHSWTVMGPWHLGSWYRPLAVVAALSCAGLVTIGMQPPNEGAAYVVGGMVVLLLAGWFASARRHFPGPPHGVLLMPQQLALAAAEKAVGQLVSDGSEATAEDKSQAKLQNPNKSQRPNEVMT